MRIKTEDFNKLNQLDRIEFRQRKTEIESNSNIQVFGYMPYFIFITGVLVLFMIAVFDPLSHSYRVILAILELSIWLIVIDFLLGILGSLLCDIKIKALEKEYFKIEINKQNEKKK